MRKYIFLFFILLYFIPFPISAAEMKGDDTKLIEILKKDPDNISALKNIGMLYLYKEDFHKAVYYGKHLEKLSSGSDKTSRYYRTQAHIILGQAYNMLGDRKEAFINLELGKTIAIEEKNDSALGSIYNGLGLYTTNCYKDYYTALKYYFKSLETVKHSNYRKLYSILMGNLSLNYYLRKDTTGLKYALECYHLGHKSNDVYLIRIGSTTAAYMYYLRHDYYKALDYIKESEAVIIRNDINDRTNLYNIYACILSKLNRNTEALFFFKKALTYCNLSQQSSILNAYIEYSRFLMKRKRYADALNLLRQGEEYIRKNNIVINKEEFYKAMSEYFEQTRQFDKALKYNKLYQKENDSLFNTEKEYIISDIQTRYGMKTLEANYNKAQFEKAQKEKALLLLFVIFIIILIIAGALFYLYRRKSRLYLAIAKQNQQSVYREQLLEQQIEELKKRTNHSISASLSKYTGSSLSGEKGLDLFNSLETLMRKEHIYIDNMLTREKVAELLNTNRTYLSQVINEQTGKTFTQYINEYRTREAVKQLSDPQNDIPLKVLSANLGFNSMTTFYNLFQNMVDLTPTQYRTSVKTLYKQKLTPTR